MTASPDEPDARPRPAARPPGEAAVEAAILSHVLARGPDKSICPSEVAMAMGPDWRTKLSAVRRAAIRLAQAGQIEILRKGKALGPGDLGEVKGVIRLRMRDPGANTI